MMIKNHKNISILFISGSHTHYTFKSKNLEFTCFTLWLCALMFVEIATDLLVFSISPSCPSTDSYCMARKEF